MGLGVGLGLGLHENPVHGVSLTPPESNNETNAPGNNKNGGWNQWSTVLEKQKVKRRKEVPNHFKKIQVSTEKLNELLELVNGQQEEEFSAEDSCEKPQAEEEVLKAICHLNALHSLYNFEREDLLSTFGVLLPSCLCHRSW